MGDVANAGTSQKLAKSISNYETGNRLGHSGVLEQIANQSDKAAVKGCI